MSNEYLCKYLKELDYEVCCVIFTKFDAETMADRTITDEEWELIVEDFNDTIPTNGDWELLGEIVMRNLREISDDCNR